MMLICFITNGLGAFGLRIMQGMGLAETFKLPYLMLWYWSGFILAAILFFRKQSRPFTRAIVIGAGLALSSVIGQVGMAFVLQYGIPGFVVFQVAPGGGLFFVVLVGILFFKERVSAYGITGIILGMTSSRGLGLRLDLPAASMNFGIIGFGYTGKQHARALAQGQTSLPCPDGSNSHPCHGSTLSAV
ncbi:hypothetical protein MYX84_10780 [Acidobacteria bacterium AH-259-O06]|nr:hypothetical protein [Acidobacteria bacterium AH-259-O06]